jgi:hypothetical protein
MTAVKREGGQKRKLRKRAKPLLECAERKQLQVNEQEKNIPLSAAMGINFT